jgi:hypothetical protein
MHENIDLRLKTTRLDFLDACNLSRLSGIAKVSESTITLALPDVERLLCAGINIQVDIEAKSFTDIRFD